MTNTPKYIYLVKISSSNIDENNEIYAAYKLKVDADKMCKYCNTEYSKGVCITDDGLGMKETIEYLTVSEYRIYYVIPLEIIGENE